ncbi:MAG TPA: hypothetical protein VEI02_14610 [Planctomycetota bacterium]|nr:hypothetical protein [Planctomycetota bacterium]
MNPGTLMRTAAAALAAWAAAGVFGGGPAACASDAAARAASAAAGPPTLCFPIDIGDARSLPWTNDGPDPAYDAPVRLVDDVLALLKSDADPLVRMETLRRATFYAYGLGAPPCAPAVAQALRLALAERALDAEAAGVGVAAAWLDAAWAEACRGDLREAPALRPYAWLTRARVALGREDAAYEFAAAVLTHHARALGREALEPKHAGHVRRAAQLAADGSQVAKNLLARFGSAQTDLRKLREG